MAQDHAQARSPAFYHILLLGHVKIKLMPMLMPLLKLELESEYFQCMAGRRKSEPVPEHEQ